MDILKATLLGDTWHLVVEVEPENEEFTVLNHEVENKLLKTLTDGHSSEVKVFLSADCRFLEALQSARSGTRSPHTEFKSVAKKV